MQTETNNSLTGHDCGRKYRIVDTKYFPRNDLLITNVFSRIKKYSDGELVNEILLGHKYVNKDASLVFNYSVIRIGMTELGVAPNYAKILNSGGDFKEFQMENILSTHILNGEEKKLAFDPYSDFCKSCEKNLKSSRSRLDSDAICWFIAYGKKHLQDFVTDPKNKTAEDEPAGDLAWYSKMNEKEIDDIFWFLEKKLGVDTLYKSWTDGMKIENPNGV
ncbi:MAG: hypothetical protein ABIF85_07415 [Nanoarchaeota archaeon]|nr:hypothetical protein [Nanoarchaeota archaeon]MBU4299589.1 hypothetical protein [Nanoarchaeota archaeon]MBU4452104.1 hypothetical protein [Nanoarchaeota archaeon]MCG2723728.1 hypothetical protein [archaeon]